MLSPNPQQCQGLLDLVNRTMKVRTYAEFRALLENELRSLLPYQVMIAGFGYITNHKTVQAHKLISVDFPIAYLKEIATPDGGFTSPKMMAWMQSRCPQVYEAELEDEEPLPPEWISKLHRFGLRNILAHGMHDLQGQCTSYFALANLPERLDDRHAILINVVVPVLHSALQRIIDDVPFLGIEPAFNREHFTPREIDLLHYLAGGQPRKTIATRLGISDNTLRNRLHRLYEKLGVTRSVGAVERAKALRLI